MAANGSVCDALVRPWWPGLTPESHSNPLKAFLRNYKMHQCAWTDCRWCSNLCRPWLLPLAAWRTLLEATTTERRMFAYATKHTSYVLCETCFRASVDVESSATGVSDPQEPGPGHRVSVFGVRPCPQHESEHAPAYWVPLIWGLCIALCGCLRAHSRVSIE
jgi:hypothetical protein